MCTELTSTTTAYDLPALVGPVPSDIVAEFGALKRRIINVLSV